MALDTAPFIGINGIPPHTEVRIRERLCDEQIRLKRLGYMTLFGVQVSSKSQGWDIENRYGSSWYPVGDELRRYFVYNGDVLHINSDNDQPYAVHLLAKHAIERSMPEGLHDKIANPMRHRTGLGPRGIQFNNLPFHLTGRHDYRPVFEKLREMYGLTHIILQLPGWLMLSCEPDELAAITERYNSYISHVLVDGSGGQGVPLQVDTVEPYIEELYDRGLSVGVAGGLGPDGLHGTEQLLAKFPGLSLDAEANLRAWSKSSGDRRKAPFDVERARSFLNLAAMTIEQSK